MLITHNKQFEIRWGDMDSYNHVNNTNYFLFVQEARLSFLNDNNIPTTIDNSAPILANTSCSFIHPIKYPEIINVTTSIEKIERKKIFFTHVISSYTDSKKIYARLEALVIWYDFVNQKSIMPPKITMDLIYGAESGT